MLSGALQCLHLARLDELGCRLRRGLWESFNIIDVKLNL